MGIYDELLQPVSRLNGMIPGIVVGIVKENWDEEHPGMIKVEYFLGEKGKNLTGWVPVAAPYAGNEFGYYALPEVGSEVVLAFQMGDRNCPIVMGSVWSKKNIVPKETSNEKNTVKKLRTKGGCEIVFSEESGKEQILIQTPKNLKIMLEDEKETIQVSDKDGKNGITIDTKQGVMTLTADKKMELKIGGDTFASLDGNTKTIELTAGKLVGKADQSVEIKGQSLKTEGTSVEVKGSGSLKLESSGSTQVKGAMVQIN